MNLLDFIKSGLKQLSVSEKEEVVNLLQKELYEKDLNEEIKHIYITKGKIAACKYYKAIKGTKSSLQEACEYIDTVCAGLMPQYFSRTLVADLDY